MATSDRAPSITSSSSKLTASGHPTASLTKRLLFSHLALSEPTPPLLHSSSTYPALDAELYDLIALALRAYVNPWWTKITRYDKQLLVELMRILSSALHTLEAKALAADLSTLAYHDLPTLLAQHCADYCIAPRKLGSSYAATGSASLPMLFHGQQQHVGVSLDGKIDQVYVRAAVDVVLKACLSPEDWEAEAEQYLIREMIVKTVCVDLAQHVTQPWFLHSAMLDLLGNLHCTSSNGTHPSPHRHPRCTPARSVHRPYTSVPMGGILFVNRVFNFVGEQPISYNETEAVCSVYLHTYIPAVFVMRNNAPVFCRFPKSDHCAAS